MYLRFFCDTVAHTHCLEHLSTLSNGIRLYSFRYLWDEQVQVGVMAQDLLADPDRRDAVSEHPSGYYMVDYGKLGLRMVTLKEWRAAHQ